MDKSSISSEKDFPPQKMSITPEAWAKVQSISFSTEDYTERVGYTQVNHLVTLCKISDGAFRTYVLIRGLAQRGNGITWGLARLAVLRGVGRQTLTRHLAELSEIGLIERRRRVGTSSETHFPSLMRVFPALASQCIAAALWCSVESDEDLRELVQQVGAALSPLTQKGVNECTKSASTVDAKMRQKEEEVKKKKYKLPVTASRGSAAEPQTIPVDAEGEPLDEYHRSSRPKWQCPETQFQRDFLEVCHAKWFKPKQKTRVKKLAKCLEIGDVLADGVYAKCLDELKDHDDFPDRPIAMPRSWYEWRVEHARSNRWSVGGFINALFDRDALVRHCQLHQKKTGQQETTEEYARRMGYKIVT